jgi:hypothetical protein
MITVTKVGFPLDTIKNFSQMANMHPPLSMKKHNKLVATADSRELM